MKIAKKVLELIGRNPIIKPNEVASEVEANLIEKLEFLNQAEVSRIGYMIQTAEKKGRALL